MSCAQGEDSYIPLVSDNIFVAPTVDMRSLYKSPPKVYRKTGSPPPTYDIRNGRVAYDLQNLNTRHTTFSGENLVRQS